ncbi:MAG: lipopolysaccharide biosynthesis protein [Methylobacter sp.]
MSASPYSGTSLKRSAAHFLIGKVASALLNLGILLWLVRLLAVDEYGAYVALVAGAELAMVITSFGLPWVAARYLPEYRLHGNGKQLTRFVWQVIAWICLFTVGGAVLLFVVMPWLLGFLDLVQQLDVARLYLLVLVLESLRRNIQECILEPLLQQRQAQLSQVMRNLSVLLCLGGVVIQGTVHLHYVVLAELAGTTMAIGLTLLGLIRHLRIYRDLQGKDDWKAPNWPKMWSTACHMYFSNLINMTYSQPTFIFLTQRFLGVEATALFGFLINLYGQISRYLPASLFFGLIRPKLIASYVGEGGMAQLTRNSNLVGKLSLFVLMPFLVFTWLAGGELLSLLSGGKFIHSGYYLGGLLLMLIPLSQRQILETVAVACGKSYICFWGSSLGILILPLSYWLFETGHGLWSPIIAMIVGQVIFNTTLITMMRVTTSYRPDTTGLFKMMMSALLGITLGILGKMAWAYTSQPCINGAVELLKNIQCVISGFLAMKLEPTTYGWLGLAILAVIACTLFFLVSYFFKPFRVDERMRLNQILKRNVFIW